MEQSQLEESINISVYYTITNWTSFIIYGKIESMHSNFRNVVERRSNGSAHGSPPRTRHGSVKQNCISSMEEDG